MSDDEVMLFLFSLGATAVLWGRWYWLVTLTARRCSRFRDRWLLAAVPLACTALLLVVLVRLAAADVRDAPHYVLLYLLLGAAWVGMGVRLLALFGLSARDDVVERGNRAAATALGGGLVGLTLCYAGGNVGNGPGWWVVVFCAALSTGALLLLWLLLDRVTGLADAVTIDRDRAAGLRLAGFFIGAGLILGRAVAGDWHSTAATVADFVRFGWPVLPLFAVAVLLERRLRPSPERPAPPVATHGWLPAALYAWLGYVLVAATGGWA